MAVLKKAIPKFLIFLAKKYCPKPSHRWLKGFAGDELRLGATDNFVKKSVPASRPIISAPIGPRDLKFFVVGSQTMPNKM